MTNQQAIILLKELKGIVNNTKSFDETAKKAVHECYDLAIKALEEIEANNEKDC